MRTGADATDLNSTNTITMKEWEMFATTFYDTVETNFMWQQGLSMATREKPLVLAIDNWEVEGNPSLRNRDLKGTMDQMINSLRKKFMEATSGRVAFAMTMSGKASKGNISTLTNTTREVRGSSEFEQDNVAGFQDKAVPTLSLQGTIVVNKFNEEGGRGKKSDYQVAFRLIDLRRGLSIMEDVVPLPKSFSPGLFGG